MLASDASMSSPASAFRGGAPSTRGLTGASRKAARPSRQCPQRSRLRETWRGAGHRPRRGLFPPRDTRVWRKRPRSIRLLGAPSSRRSRQRRRARSAHRRPALASTFPPPRLVPQSHQGRAKRGRRRARTSRQTAARRPRATVRVGVSRRSRRRSWRCPDPCWPRRCGSSSSRRRSSRPTRPRRGPRRPHPARRSRAGARGSSSTSCCSSAPTTWIVTPRCQRRCAATPASPSRCSKWRRRRRRSGASGAPRPPRCAPRAARPSS